jgi:putative ABC transport system permease protein
MAVLGIAVGVTAAILLARLVAGLLYGVASSDPATYVAVSILLALVAIAATLVPARRATLVDPALALRAD